MDDDPKNKVLVVRTGTANLASVLAGLRRAGCEPELTEDAAVVERAERLVLPGVGSFGAAMKRLREASLDVVLRRHIEVGRPILAVCVGLQLLAEGSEESPDVSGLGVFEGRAARFPETVRVPQLGWNEVKPAAGCELISSAGHAYFANSYRLPSAPKDWLPALSEHAGPFVAALERGPQLLCQFHPELSGQWGLAVLRRWLTASANRSPRGGAEC